LDIKGGVGGDLSTAKGNAFVLPKWFNLRSAIFGNQHFNMRRDSPGSHDREGRV
jgi:hypothetical protein